MKSSLLAKLAGPIIIILGMLVLWHRTSAMSRVAILCAAAVAAELGAMRPRFSDSDLKKCWVARST